MVQRTPPCRRLLTFSIGTHDHDSASCLGALADVGLELGKVDVLVVVEWGNDWHIHAASHGTRGSGSSHRVRECVGVCVWRGEEELEAQDIVSQRCGLRRVLSWVDKEYDEGYERATAMG